jgi:hypothetical protein
MRLLYLFFCNVKRKYEFKKEKGFKKEIFCLKNLEILMRCIDNTLNEFINFECKR